MDRHLRPTLWYGLVGLAFMEWLLLAAFGAFWIAGAAFAIANGTAMFSDWRMPYLGVLCTAALSLAGLFLWRFNRRERGAKRIAPPIGAVTLGLVFLAMMGIVGD